MEETSRKFRICSLQALLKSHQMERAFLAQRCDCDDLSPVQRATILNRIDHLRNESNALKQSLGELQQEADEVLEVAKTA
jgi:hypothetical protein